LKWEKYKIYALGTWFYKDAKEGTKVTADNISKAISDIIQIWKMRYLTWLGKITVIKTFCISKLNFALSSLYIPMEFIKEQQKSFFDYIWNGKTPRVKNKVLYNDYQDGGLRLTNLELHMKAQKIMWIKRLALNRETLPFYYIMQFINLKFDEFLKCSLQIQDIDKKMPLFYKEIFTYWFELKTAPITKFDIQREVVWNNRHIQIGNKTVYYETLYNNGVVYIKDLLDQQGNLLSYRELTNKYGIHISSYNYMCLIDAIPRQWKFLLKNNEDIMIEPRRGTVFMDLKPTPKPLNIVKGKEIYWMFNNSRQC
jgi:hypothetical protein